MRLSTRLRFLWGDIMWKLWWRGRCAGCDKPVHKSGTTCSADCEMWMQQEFGEYSGLIGPEPDELDGNRWFDINPGGGRHPADEF